VFEKLTRQEKLEVPKFVREAFEAGFKEVIVVRGNHDNYVSGVLKSVGAEFVEERLDLGSGVTVTHGHKSVEGFDLAILGHEHPAINVSIGGSKIKLPVYLSMPLSDGSRVIVLPPTGAYQAGNDVTLYRENYLSPIIRERGVIGDAVPIIYDERLGALPLARLSELPDLAGL
jgi:putative SbcD/Mre11-related phosphoesterase